MHPATHPKLHSQSFFDSLSLSLSRLFHLHEQWPENKKYKSNHRTATLQSRHFCTENFDEYFLSPAITNSKPGCYLTLKQQTLPSNFKHKPVHQASTRLQVQRPQESLNQHQSNIKSSSVVSFATGGLTGHAMEVTTCAYQVLSTHPHLGNP
jgi:hypothetical protein